MEISNKDYNSKEKTFPTKHTISFDSRKAGHLTGIIDAVSFDDKEVMLETVDGMLSIKGNDIHVSNLNLDKGEVDMEGMIDMLVYTDKTSFMKKGEGLITRLFG